MPAVVDLAAMREAMQALGGDPTKINPLIPAELVIDHSVVADVFGSPDAFDRNVEIEFQRNHERFQFLRWGQDALRQFKVVPPGTGIVHQVNIEYLARVVMTRDGVAYPDTCVGTDSHTTMQNGLGVLGWGVGGIEAEAAMLGQPISMLIPKVVGFRLTGELPSGATATDLVLTITEMLRKHGVVGKFVEFYRRGRGRGPGGQPGHDRQHVARVRLHLRDLPDRPEHPGLPAAHRPPAGAARPGRGVRQGAGPVARPGARRPGTPRNSASTCPPWCRPSPGRSARRTGSRWPTPSRPSATRCRTTWTRPTLDNGLAGTFPASDPVAAGDGTRASNPIQVTLEDGTTTAVDHGSVVIAAITSCTNTSNPSVMVGAALLAKNAVDRGLARKPWVKTTLAPGSKVVMDYYERAGLLPYLDKLGFNLVGYGCTTCIGNSGPLPPAISEAVNDNDLAVTAVLSGNRNFEGRINPDVKMNYLASPPLVVAYALAGTMDIDLQREPLGSDAEGKPVYLRGHLAVAGGGRRRGAARGGRGDVHPRLRRRVQGRRQLARAGRSRRATPSPGTRRPPTSGARRTSTGCPPSRSRSPTSAGAKVLAMLGDSVTTDHISPAGAIKTDSPAGTYLTEHGVERRDFNSYGSRRGNHEVMIRGTFANIRLRNQLAPGTEGGVTVTSRTASRCRIYDASRQYIDEGTPLIVLGGKEYGSGSSRDWAAKGTLLLGVRAVLVESFERIHRSNLIGMGVLPLQYRPGESAASLGLTGEETFDIRGIEEINSGNVPNEVTVTAGDKEFRAVVRIDTPGEADYYRHGGIMQYVLRSLR